MTQDSLTHVSDSVDAGAFRFRAIGLVAAVLTASYPGRAWAAGGGSGRSIEVVLLIIAVVAIAYLVAHLVLERIADRFGVVSGVECIVVGAVIF